MNTTLKRMNNMKERNTKETKIKAQMPKSASSASPMSSRIIRKDSGTVVRQYPAHVGYHGSGEETKLNPEE